MVNGKNQYDATTKEYNKLLNSFCDELISTIKLPKSKTAHQKTYSCLYEILKNSNVRGEIESCRSLVKKVACGNFTDLQKSTATKRLKDKILYLADQSLLNVKKERRLQCLNFAKMIKAIIVKQHLFDKYITYSDLSIKNYYEAQQTALKDNPRNTITHETLSKPSGKTKNIF